MSKPYIGVSLNRIKNKLFIFIFLIPSSLIAQELTGTWYVDWPKTLSNQDYAEIQKYEKTNDLVKEQSTVGIQSRQYSFLSSGDFEITWKSRGTTKKLTGTWSFNKVESLLTLLTDNSNRKYKVKVLSDNDLLLEIVDKSENMLFPKTVITKL